MLCSLWSDLIVVPRSECGECLCEPIDCVCGE